MKRFLLAFGSCLLFVVMQARCEEQQDDVTDVSPDLVSNGWQVRMPVGVPPQPFFGETPLSIGSGAINLDGMSFSTNWLPRILPPSEQDAAVITETALALNNDFDAIYRFVRDNVRFTPSWGFARGAARTLLDREGNDADQALLLAALLRAAGYAATVDYCILDMFDANDPGGYDVLHWLGVADVDAAVLEMWQAGYYPYWYSDYGVFEVDRFIVLARDANGTVQQLDPAFKPRVITRPRAALPDMGYSRSGLLSAALSGATTDTNNYVRLLNDAGVRAAMNQLAGNLAAAWHAATSNADASAFAGSDMIVPQSAWDSSYFHGYDAYDFSTDLFAESAATVNQFRTGVTLAHGSLTNAFWMDEMASRTVWLDYTNATGYAFPKAVLHVDDSVLATEATGSAQSNVTATISITNTVLTFLSMRQPYGLVRSTANVFVIPTGLSSSYGGMRDRDARALERLCAANPPGSHRVTAQALQVAGQEWLLQTACNTKLLGRLNGNTQTPFYRMGFAGQTLSPYVDLKNVYVYQTTFSGRLDSEMLLASALEHGILNQVNGDTNAVSTVGVLVRANRAGIRLCLATSGNFDSFVKPQLSGYGTNLLSKFKADTDAGNKIFLPTNGAIPIGIWKGCVYAEYGTQNGNFVELMSISGLDGGVGTAEQQIPPSVTSQNSAPVSVRGPAPAYIPMTTTADPVDLRSGACLSDHTDLVVGGPLPLALARAYDSRRADSAGPLGRGWSLAPNIRAAVHTDIDSMTGGRSPEECASAVAACTVIEDLLSSGETALNLGVAAIVADWLVASYQNGAVSVYLGDRPLTFIRRADGVYSPPPGTSYTLAGTNGAFSLSERLGGTWHFDRNNNATNYVDPDGNAIRYAYNSQSNLVAVSNSFGRGFSLAWNSSNQIASASGPDGRVIRYAYSAAGTLTNVTDVAGMNWRFAYDAANRLVAQTDPEGWLVSSNAYNALDQVTNQLSASGRRWTFRNADGLQGWQDDPDGRRTLWYYDPDGRPATRFAADGGEDDWYYDGQGHMLYHDDPIGIWTVNAYDFSNNLLSTVSAAFTDDALTNGYQYDAACRLTAATDAAGRVTRYQWDAKHHLTATLHPDGSAVTNTYYANGLPATVRVTAGGQTLRQTAFSYDSRGFATNTAATDAGATAAAYDGCGNVTALTDPNGHATQYRYDPRGLLTNTLDAAGGRTVRTYWRNGLLRSVTDAVGHSATSSWTHAGNPAATRFADGGVATNEYDAADRLVSATDPRGNRVAFDLDPMGRVTRSHTSGWQTFACYNIDGCVTARLDAVSGRTDTFYDWLNRPVTVYDPMRSRWSTLYNPMGSVAAATDPRSRTTAYGYDAMERRTRTVYPSGRAEADALDALGRRVAFTNSENRVYRMAYDAQGRLTAATNALGEQTVRNLYDLAGNLTNRTDGAGAVTRYRYDALNRCTNTVYADGAWERFGYDAAGNLLSASNAASRLTFGYDAMNRLISSETRVAGQTFAVTYGYDLGGFRTNVVYPGGLRVRTTYDADGRVAAVTDWANHTWTFTRDAAGRMTALACPNGVSGAWTYDANHAVASWSFSSGGAPFAGREITRDEAGIKTGEHVTAGLFPTPPSPRRASNVFNAADRLTSATVAEGTNTYEETYLYDGNGALTNRQSAAGEQQFEYDRAGRLTFLQLFPINSSLFLTFDALGNRLTTYANNATRVWITDHADPLKRPLLETDANGVPQRYYVWGGGMLLAAVEADGTVRYCHSDEQGSVVALTDASGAVTDQYCYGPYGTDWGHSGTNSIPFRWLGSHGVYNVGGSALYLTRHRAYDASTGRFLSQDPLGLGGGPNLYAYALCNPLAYIDPLGLCGSGYDQYRSTISADTRPYNSYYSDGFWESGNGPDSRALYHADQLVPEAYIGSAMGDQWVSDRYQTAANAIAAEFVVGETVAAYGRVVNSVAENGGLAAPGSSVTIGGVRATEIAGRTSPSEMAALQAEHGTEFAQVYLTGPGRGGGGGAYYLIQGSEGTVNIPVGNNVMLINHTHPEMLGSGTVPLTASSADYNVLRLLQQAGSPQRTSQIVPQVGTPFNFRR